MDQLKDILKQAVKYRFWIAVGVSLLLPMIAYFVGSGPVKAKAKEATDKIVSADKEVAGYMSPGLPNAQYKPLVAEKTEIVTVDVNKAWDKLYARQAPLLKWPETVEDRFHVWGRKWPENIDKGAVQKAITDYVLIYDKAVTETYKKVNPFDPMTGNGIVRVPDEKSLLRPAAFDPTLAVPPKLGKVWAAQERLWIQGTLLDAVAGINKSARSWDDAIVKQIDLLEVGSPLAQDQKSMADGEAVEMAPSLDPDGDAAAAASPAAGGAMGGGAYGGGDSPGGKMGMLGASGGGMGGASQATEDVYYLANPSTQFKILPVQMVVLVDQNRLQDFFIGLENSPMAIQVMEFDMVKPTTPVTKPVKGEAMAGGMGGGMGYGGGGYGGGGKGMMSGEGPMGYGGAPGGGMSSSKGYGGGQGAGMMAGGMPGGYGGDPRSGGGYGGGMALGGAGGGTVKKGTDVRTKDLKKEREAKEKTLKSMTRSNVDQYYNIVQVTIYGRARFYNSPPPAEPTTPSESAGAAASGGTPAVPAASTVTDPGAPAPTVDPAKAATPKADPAKTEAPKVEDPKAETPKAETPKAETPKAETPKAETPKAEVPKVDAPKADPAKTDVPKAAPTPTSAPKADAAKPAAAKS